MNWTTGKFSLSPSTVFRIRSLKLQRKWQKGHRGGVESAVAMEWCKYKQ